MNVLTYIYSLQPTFNIFHRRNFQQCSSASKADFFKHYGTLRLHCTRLHSAGSHEACFGWNHDVVSIASKKSRHLYIVHRTTAKKYEVVVQLILVNTEPKCGVTEHQEPALFYTCVWLIYKNTISSPLRLETKTIESFWFLILAENTWQFLRCHLDSTLKTTSAGEKWVSRNITPESSINMEILSIS